MRIKQEIQRRIGRTAGQGNGWVTQLQNSLRHLLVLSVMLGWVGMAAAATTLITSPNPSLQGQGVVLTATITTDYPVSGTITFKDGAIVLGTVPVGSCTQPIPAGAGTARLGYTFSMAGNHSLTASFSGGKCQFYAYSITSPASTSPVVVQSVNLATSSTALSSSLNPSTAGQAVTLTANVTGVTPTGTVTFMDGATVVGTSALVLGSATIGTTFASSGSHSLTAWYSGDSKNTQSSSPAISQTVNAATSATVLGVSPNPSTVGQVVNLTAVVSGYPVLGTITFRDGTTVLGTVSIGSSTSPPSVGTAALSYTFIAAGAHSLTASYSGGTYQSYGYSITTPPSTSPAVTQTVNVKPTTTGLTSGTNPSVAGQAVALTATVTGATPTGIVTFKDGATILGTGSITTGVATFSATFATAGAHSLTAVYAGDTNNATSTSTAVSQTVNVKPTTTSLTSGINPSVAGQAVTLTASVSGYLPTGIVTFKDGAAVLGTAAISAGQATFSAAFTSAGAHSLSASYSGDANNVASGSAAVGQAVNQAATSTTLGTSANPSAYGAAINLTATVSGYAPSGTVTFKDGAAVLGTAAISAGQATFSAAFTSAGAHSLSASYSGDANNVASSSAAVAQTVNISATTTTLTATPGTFVAGQAVSLSATISGASPGGTVTFKDGATVLGTGTIAAGKATLNITLSTAGTHSLSASYAGDANNAASNSTALTQSVGVATSSTGLTISANPSTAGQAITLTANITGVLPTGTVTFKDGAAVLGSGSITAGKAILSVSLATVGTHSLSASYAGDANNAASSSAAVSQTVNISPTTTTLTPSPTAGTGQSVTLTASVTGAVPTGTVTFTEGTTTLGTSVLVSGLSTLSVNFGQAGKHSLSASYSGDANNSPSTSITVNQNVSAQVYYIHSDHLDTPRQITDTAGNVVWQRDNTDPYGNNIANENPSGLGKFTCNLGFPGQYFDIESGLFYNRLRDGYDPATGRYTQGDPVGLYGGSWSIFIYAGGNPLSWIDPWGLTHYNAPPPQTVPPTGRVAEQLSCMDRCTGKDLLITGGKEKKGHKGKKHGENKACDIAGPEFNSELDNQKVFSCAVQCGFTNGQYEDFPGVSRDHWHLQDGSGSGVPELPPGSLWDRFKHQINEITLPKE